MKGARSQTYEIVDPRQLEALALPRRQDILDRLAASGPLSVNELAEHIGGRSTALYHHISKLLEVGLVVEAGTRVRRRRREQLYRTPAPRMRLRRAHSDPAHAEQVADIVEAQARQMGRDFRAGQDSPAMIPQGKARNHTFYRLIGRPDPAELGRINACLSEIAEILYGSNDPKADLISIAFVMSPLEPGARTKRRLKGKGEAG